MKLSKIFTTLSLAVTLAISSVTVPLKAEKAEAQPVSQRPYAVFVNGYEDCCAWGMENVRQALLNMGVEIRYVPWDSFRNGANQRSRTSNDRQFLREAENFINNQLDPNRPLILIGHSFGGDSLLSLAPRIKRRILFLGVIDPVAAGGFREPIRRREIPSNVDYFFNRWQSNRLDTDNVVPFDSALSGRIQNCHAKNCDQEEQNIARRADGSPIVVKCGSLEVTCPGYEPWPGGSNGRKQKRLHHNPMPYDAYIQQQIIERVNTSIEIAKGRKLYFRNNCSQPIRLALTYMEPSGNWRTDGWWSFEANEDSYLASNGQRIRSNNSIFYYYAEITASGYNYSWRGNDQIAFQGGTLQMRREKLSPDSDGNYVLSIACPNAQR